MKVIKRNLNLFKKIILPPYTGKDISILGVILIVLTGLVLFGINFSKDTNIFLRASTINSIEPENGTINGDISVINNASASGGKTIKFGNIYSPTPAVSPTVDPTATSSGQIWVTSSGNILRFNDDGSSAGSFITGNGIHNPFFLAVVGKQVWITNPPDNSISRFNFDGSSAGSPITGNELGKPSGIKVIGSQVWVANGDYPHISRFNFDGTPTTPLNTINGGCTTFTNLAQVGTQIWITATNNNIYRFNQDGSMAGNPLTGNGINDPYDIAVVGSQVWVVNYLDSSISRFNFDGSSAGSTLTNYYGQTGSMGIVVVGSEVWVTNRFGVGFGIGYISRYNFDGKLINSNVIGRVIDWPKGIVFIPSASPVPNPTTSPTPIRITFPSATPVPNPGSIILPTIDNCPIPTVTASPSAKPTTKNQVWVANYNNGISRFNTDGTPAGVQLTGNSLNRPWGIAKVGSQIWVTNNYTHSISRFNSDGSSAGSLLSGNGLYYPSDLAIIGTQVWVLNTNYPKSGIISRFNFDGTVAGPPLKNLDPRGFDGIMLVNSKVWVTSNASVSGNINWLNLDGSYSGKTISGYYASNYNFDSLIGLHIVGSQVWVISINYPSTPLASGSIMRLNFDGTNAGNLIIDNGINSPRYLSTVESQVWVTNSYSNSISRFNFDGTAYDTPLYGNGLNNPKGIAEILF